MQGKAATARHADHHGHFTTSWLRSRRAGASCLALVALSIVLAGCGGSSSASKPSASQTSSSATTTVATTPASKADPAKHVPIVEKVEIASPAFAPDGVIPARYTCDGADTPPPLRWGGIPANTAELALYIIRLEPVHKHLVFAWAVAGINPKLHGLSGNKLPAGAVVGLNSNGNANYEVCLPKSAKEGYVTVLLALPRSEHPKPGFDATTQRIEALRQAEYEGFLVFRDPRR
jgi:phosphatidylethanolamine-binding protein (PEBP) family uncharacterized protein